MKMANLPSRMVIERTISTAPGAVSMPWNSAVSPGSSTSTSTMAMSCTISQPTVMRPRSVSISRRSWSTLSRTTVLATDSATPKMSPAPADQPSDQPTAMPSGVATSPCASAPGTAIARTASKSLSEKCKPTPNIKRMTPTSASWLAIFWSATKPGVKGPMTIPATRYPTSGGSLKRLASTPKAKASTRPIAMVDTSGGTCSIRARSWPPP